MVASEPLTSGTAYERAPARRRLLLVKKDNGPAIDTGRQELYRQDTALLLLLTLLTTCIWLITIFLGCQHNTGFKAAKADVPLIWFDRLIRVAGPLLPLPILVIHWYAKLPAGAVSRAAAGAVPHQRSMVGLGALYMGLSVSRAAVYALHTLLAPLIVLLKDGEQHPHILSDHILLGASLVAMFSAEAHVLLMDVRSSWSLRLKLDRVLMTAALVLSAALFGLTCAEMYYTARYFHGATESIVAAITGLVLFQVPAVIFLAQESLY